MRKREQSDREKGREWSTECYKEVRGEKKKKKKEN